MSEEKKIKKIVKHSAVEGETKKIAKPIAKAEAKPEAEKPVAKTVKVTAKVKPIETGKAEKKTAIDPEKVAKVKKAKLAQVEQPNIKLSTAVNDVPNPIIANKGLKRALAIALATLEKDEAKLGKLIVKAGIVFKQVNGKEDAKDAYLLAKNEWSGRNYARFAVFNVDTYTEKCPDKVKECMAFAKALVKAQ